MKCCIASVFFHLHAIPDCITSSFCHMIACGHIQWQKIFVATTRNAWLMLKITKKKKRKTKKTQRQGKKLKEAGKMP